MMNKITSVAEWKRRLAVGSRWWTYNHFLGKSYGFRTVERVRSKDIIWSDGKHFDYPKSRDVRFLDDGSIEVYRDDGELMLAYIEAPKK